MKKIIALLVLAAAIAAAPARAQQVTSASSFIVAASATTNIANNLVVIDCSSQRNVALKWTIQCGGAGTDLVGMRLFPSVDGTLPTTPTLATGYSLAIAATGATPLIVQTNFDTLGYRYLVCSYITNGVAQVMTNTLEYFVKRNAP